MSTSTPLINRVRVREFTLTALKVRRDPMLARKMTRVSTKFFFRAEAALRVWIENQLDVLPSKGKTIN